jgi:hypothetical protein
MELVVKNLDRPDINPSFPKGEAFVVQVGEYSVSRGVLQPGWRWSNDVREMMGTASCEVPHTGLTVSGRWHFEMDDGTTVDLGPGDAYSIPPGHDAWVVGDEPLVCVDWATADNEARTNMIETTLAHQDS